MMSKWYLQEDGAGIHAYYLAFLLMKLGIGYSDVAFYQDHTTDVIISVNFKLPANR